MLTALGLFPVTGCLWDWDQVKKLWKVYHPGYMVVPTHGNPPEMVFSDYNIAVFKAGETGGIVVRSSDIVAALAHRDSRAQVA